MIHRLPKGNSLRKSRCPKTDLIQDPRSRIRIGIWGKTRAKLVKPSASSAKYISDVSCVPHFETYVSTQKHIVLNISKSRFLTSQDLHDTHHICRLFCFEKKTSGNAATLTKVNKYFHDLHSNNGTVGIQFYIDLAR